MKLRTRLILFTIINLMLLTLLYYIPIYSEELSTLCIVKKITGRDCWNCGMTRAFLSILHLDFRAAYQFNYKVVIVFPFTIGLYLHSWYKYIFQKGGVRNE